MSSMDCMIVESVLDVVIDNVVKYFLDGGWIEIGVWCDGGMCWFMVWDCGLGLIDEQVVVVIDWFWCSVDIGDIFGLGFGFVIVMDLLVMVGGEFVVVVVDGGGFVVEFVFWDRIL